ncbi:MULTISPECIES: PAAR-like domain-containing protein [Myxococcus]|uniref:PAAR-like domain-containing protein n=1 Tax=Myxococcus TaxID=32 RepID=UPI0013D1B478|nr:MULTISPECIES: PAAR-like domain-containing protein [Myxococcus]NVJ24779.1 DUF4150 domain-containing protein [Myxococcus sp. AM011]
MSVLVNAPKTPVTKGSSGTATATLPNMCKMPGPPAPFVPTVLPNTGKSGESPKGYSTSVTIKGDAIAIRGASFGSSGDSASKGTGGGMASANTHGPTKFLGLGSLDVKVEGKNVQLLGDPMLNNCGPGGSPANAATLSGLDQASGGAEILIALEDIGKECNEKINREAGFPPPEKPSGRICTKLGTLKHACCDAAIKDANNAKVKSEVPLKKDGTPHPHTREDALAAGREAAALNPVSPKAAFCKAFFAKLPPISLDAVILDDSGKIAKVYDYKFNCKDQPKMSKTQKEKYKTATGMEPTLLHFW